MNRTLRRIACLFLVLVMAAVSFCGTAFADFSVKTSLSFEGTEAAEVNGMLSSSYLEVKGGSVDGSPVVNVDFELAGQTFVKLLALVGNDYLAVSVPNADPNRYEISAARVMELIDSLARTAAGPNLQLSPDMFAPPDISDEEYEAALGPYIQILSDHFSSVMTITPDSEVPLARLDRTVKGTLGIYEPDAEQLASLFEAIAKQADNDEALMKIVRGWAEWIRGLGGLITSSAFSLSGEAIPDFNAVTGSADTGYDTDESVSEADKAADGLISFFEDLPSVLSEAAEDLRENGLQGSILRFSVGVPDDPGRGSVCLFSVEMLEEDSEILSFGFETDNPGSGRDTAVYMSQGGQENKILVNDRSSNGKINGSMTIYVFGMAMGSAMYNWDMHQTSMLGIPYGHCLISVGPVSLSIDVADGTEDGSSAHTLKLTGLSGITGSDAMSGMTLTFLTTPAAQLEVPAGEVVDITDYTEEQLGELFSSIAEKIAAQLPM